VDEAGHDLLARTRFAGHEDGRVGGRDLGRVGQRVLPLLRSAQRAVRAPGLQLLGQDLDPLLEAGGAVLRRRRAPGLLGQVVMGQGEGDVIGHAHRELGVVVVELGALMRGEDQPPDGNAVAAHVGAHDGAYAHLGVELDPGVGGLELQDRRGQWLQVEEVHLDAAAVDHGDVAGDQVVPVQGVLQLARHREFRHLVHVAFQARLGVGALHLAVIAQEGEGHEVAGDDLLRDARDLLEDLPHVQGAGEGRDEPLQRLALLLPLTPAAGQLLVGQGQGDDLGHQSQRATVRFREAVRLVRGQDQ